ncbi:hypothetical protein BCh11DRAFT_01945 [Burkholderia sp. Ch1-1]|uniref:hypothetical protein n=1 Tax=Paraburkholderia sp. USG1 TaxID=2952268 RepID=UPI0001D23CF9|nr:hypothetical protein [Paraburkholderia sp. USG1]EIF34147.1 hypothetical protein BCh11DRAFT_01945 [Burkholderia sp. Ch1-1]MDR8396002.1 hypothetical protein [Paraburkholderia sp. USG1]
MNIRNRTRNVLLISTLLAASSLAMAQGSGGGGGGPAGSDPNGGTTAGTTREGGDMQASGAMAHSKSTRTHHMKKSKATKPATDTTNMPGADASSDTKGQ